MPSPHFGTFLDELQARVEIEDAIKLFIRGIDRRDWALARSTYHDDALDEHGFFSGPPDAFLDAVAVAHTHQDHSMHVMSNILIEFAARDRALVETYCLVFQRFGAAAEGVPPGQCGLRRFGTARYLDVFESRAGTWRVARRRLVFADLQTEPLGEPVRFPPGFHVQKHGMDDTYYEWRAGLMG